jgi:hypothetical protein
MLWEAPFRVQNWGYGSGISGWGAAAVASRLLARCGGL